MARCPFARLTTRQVESPVSCCSRPTCSHSFGRFDSRLLHFPSQYLFVPVLIELKDLFKCMHLLMVRLIGRYHLIGFDRRRPQEVKSDMKRTQRETRQKSKRAAAFSGKWSRRCSERQSFLFTTVMLPCCTAYLFRRRRSAIDGPVTLAVTSRQTTNNKL